MTKLQTCLIFFFTLPLFLLLLSLAVETVSKNQKMMQGRAGGGAGEGAAHGEKITFLSNVDIKAQGRKSPSNMRRGRNEEGGEKSSGSFCCSSSRPSTQCLQLLLGQPLLLLQLLVPDEQVGCGLQEAVVEQQLLVAELLLQEGRHHLLPPLQVLLQLVGILPLLAEQTMAAIQGALQRKGRKRKKRIF